jgi:hypothetical protein
MTRDEILNMPAGREMDVTIGYHVMDLVAPPEIYPEYSTDIAAAWEVVEQMQKNGYCFDADGNALRRRIRFGVGQEIGEAETMPLAICRAALLAFMEAS